jgi:hypothetical protein
MSAGTVPEHGGLFYKNTCPLRTTSAGMFMLRGSPSFARITRRHCPGALLLCLWRTFDDTVFGRFLSTMRLSFLAIRSTVCDLTSVRCDTAKAQVIRITGTLSASERCKERIWSLRSRTRL